MTSLFYVVSPLRSIQHTVTRRFSFTLASAAAVASGVTTGCAWPGRGESVTELMPIMNFLVHSYTCCSDRHASPYWTFIRRWISMGFTPSLLKKADDRTLFFFGACCERGRHLYTTTAPSCYIPASYCHLSATLQTISITVVSLQYNRAVFWIFIALLRFSFDSPSYNNMTRSRDNCRREKAVIYHILSVWTSCIQLWGCTRQRNIDINQGFQNKVQWCFFLRRLVLRRFTFTTLVQSDRALPTCGASLSQFKRPFCT